MTIILQVTIRQWTGCDVFNPGSFPSVCIVSVSHCIKVNTPLRLALPPSLGTSCERRGAEVPVVGSM